MPSHDNTSMPWSACLPTPTLLTISFASNGGLTPVGCRSNGGSRVAGALMLLQWTPGPGQQMIMNFCVNLCSHLLKTPAARCQAGLAPFPCANRGQDPELPVDRPRCLCQKFFYLVCLLIIFQTISPIARLSCSMFIKCILTFLTSGRLHSNQV